MAAKTIEGRFLQNDGFFWAAGSEQASKAHVRNKRAIKHLGKLYLPTTRRVEQKFVDELDPTILYGFFLLAPIHSVGILQGPSVL